MSTRALLLLLLLGLIACTEAEPASQPTAVLPSASQPTATQSLPTKVPTIEVILPTATALSSPTLPPPPTVIPPTNTPIPTVTPIPATATPAPVALFTIADFGADRNFLTGVLAPDPSWLQRRPIAVKLSNSPPEYTRPQAGLNHADLVFEHVTEGPITRFTAVLYGQTPPDVGPIRSARLIDLEIPAMYDTALSFSGASSGADGVYNRLAASDFRHRLVRDIADVPGYYRTDEEDKPWEHRLHAIPEELWLRMDEMDINQAPAYPMLMAFTSNPPSGGSPASHLTVRYRTWTEVDWEFDAANGRYWRWSDGEPHVDANDGVQVSAANVIVVYAIHQQVVSICESQEGDTCHAHSTEIQIWGSGDAIILRDGQQYAATWKREKRDHMLTFYDEGGDPVPLQIGNSWIQVVPYHYHDPVSVE